ncbi:TetR/AcrR family transcriptional regulator [Microbacterium sp. P06]|uniref:TetR/AcrR family transcriptional regulator n=1 Tax=unclassified Microbacterium TaxID=2609290 RepID=UPI00374570DA
MSASASDTVADTPQGRPRDSRLDAALLEATVLLIEEKGYAALTTAAVAQRAGVSTASLYRRWASKEELVATAAAALIADFAVDHSTGTLDGDLTALLETKVALLGGRTGSVLRSLSGRATHDPELAAIIERDVYGLARDHVAAVLERAAARGEITGSVGTAVATDLVMGMVVVPLFLAADGPDAVAAIDVPQRVAVLRRALGA